MSLTNLDKDNTNRLFQMLSLNTNNDIEIIKSNYACYTKLELISEQIYNLQIKAHEIIKECNLNDQLNKLPIKFKKTPGTYYYHYLFEDKEILSMISPEEWDTYTKFLGKYYYNYDCIFYRQQ